MSNNYMYDENMSLSIINALSNGLRDCGIDAEVSPRYNCSSLYVGCNELYLWIRLEPSSNMSKLVINISTVEFTEENQRKGYFTKLIDALVACEYVGYVKISSVCSDCMFSWLADYGKNYDVKVAHNGVDYILGGKNGVQIE